MGDDSLIEWLLGPDGRRGLTWNFVTGCDRLSEGCLGCYIERQTPMRVAGRRFSGPQIGATTGILLHPDRLDMPLRKRDPRRIFVNSMSDLWHDQVPDQMIAQAFAVMAMTPQHTYLILTKRPARMRAVLRSDGFWRAVGKYGQEITEARMLGKYRSASPMQLTDDDGSADGYWMPVRPLPNVQIGVSVENQKWADIRIPILLDTPHIATRWISAEPLLGPINLDKVLYGDGPCPMGDPDCLGDEGDCHDACERALDWVVAGGESGPKARPMHPDWARGLRDQCTAAGVPFFFKLHGEWMPIGPLYGDLEETDEGHVEAVHLEVVEGKQVIQLESSGYIAEGHQPGDSRTWLMAKVGKHQAGAVLDGQTWTEYPDA
ncbi:phage Gp37/Gp68 family protein [Nonomuraea sp. SYSU D8015]|uniref:phage Gp37/Gp68 family protein n=1 Tax=Nonomuraea sp. SYSU D8015 TaxID=2593644 RepID=UPI001660DEC6|nr:phage Gp37/Gp68 family protein [Nonomuraea sp. SYSU D8015]